MPYRMLETGSTIMPLIYKRADRNNDAEAPEEIDSPAT